MHFPPKTSFFCARSATATEKTTLHSEALCAVSLFASRVPLMRVASVRHDSGAQITGILTRPSQLGSARWVGIGAGRGWGGLLAHIYSPAELSKLAFDKREEGAEQRDEGCGEGMGR